MDRSDLIIYNSKQQGIIHITDTEMHSCLLYILFSALSRFPPIFETSGHIGQIYFLLPNQ